MKSFLIAWKDFKIRITDRKGFLMMIFMPLILTAILGIALDSVMSGGGNLPESTVGYYQADDDPLAEDFLNDVLKDEQMNHLIKIKHIKSKQQIKEALEDGEIDVGMMIPKRWSQHIKEGRMENVIIYSDPEKSVKASIVESIVSSYTERVKAVALVSNTVMSDLSVRVDREEMEKVSGDVINHITQTAMDETAAISKQTVGKKSITAMQYYAAAMSAMFLLYSATTGAKSILQERETQTLARLMASPTSKSAILFGKFLGTLLFTVIQLTIFLLGTRILFKVDWGNNLFQLLSLGIAYSIAISGLSMILAAMIRKTTTADNIGGIGVQILAILGGSMVPINAFPDILQKISNIVPNKWALTGFLDIMAGTTWNHLLLPISVLTILGLVSVILGTTRLKAQ